LSFRGAKRREIWISPCGRNDKERRLGWNEVESQHSRQPHSSLATHHSSLVTAVPPCRACDFLLLAQKKVTKEKGTPRKRRLRRSLRCSPSGGRRVNSCCALKQHAPLFRRLAARLSASEGGSTARSSYQASRPDQTYRPARCDPLPVRAISTTWSGIRPCIVERIIRCPHLHPDLASILIGDDAIPVLAVIRTPDCAGTRAA